MVATVIPQDSTKLQGPECGGTVFQRAAPSTSLSHPRRLLQGCSDSLRHFIGHSDLDNDASISVNCDAVFNGAVSLGATVASISV